MERAEAPEGACLVTVEGGCQEEAQKEKGKEEGGVNEIAQEVVEGSKEKVSVHDGIKEAVQRKVGKVSREAGLVTKSRWQHSGMKSKTGGDLGTKKDRRKLLEFGGHA